ncbi:hypothetical protein PMZ80_005087 [Knufia obscura]|uniref:RNI-like protein n=1 Tax=Knufia obscura TaxID=1635080 RepID=A0ABR0RPI6_9EURO|nr:hypothetical protein PMZ80_005087 [Knufia obscura]
MSSGASQASDIVSASEGLYPAEEFDPRPTWSDRVKLQGPWNQQRTPEELLGAPSLPMPVSIATAESLTPCFDHIMNNGTHLPPPTLDKKYEIEAEPNYETPYIEFEKGVIYEDRRMDMCKMVLGPPGIDRLLDSLEQNDFIQHFLLGNNIIGPAGCRRIARFLDKYPNRMDTWYLAGNCIDSFGFEAMVDGLARSVATNIWLKRNPLGPSSKGPLARLIRTSTQLRTLDLDQTELGDDGVAKLFNSLCEHDSETALSLQNIYMNAVGVGPGACASMNRFLLSPTCQLESLYLSNNPLGNGGIAALTKDLTKNTTLQRLMLSSTGLTSYGATALFKSLTGHPTLIALDLSQSYATEDLNSHFNYISDTEDITETITDFIFETPNLRLLDLSYTALSYTSINQLITNGVLRSASLCSFSCSTVVQPVSYESQHDKEEHKARQVNKRLQSRIKTRLNLNIEVHYPGMSVNKFDSNEVRWLKGPKEDLRKIDSVYRNRDAGLARRGLKRLEKRWSEDDKTLQEVMRS